MADEPLNDNDAGAGLTAFEQEPMGQAALLLVESLLHGLIERSLLTLSEAIEIVENAAEVSEVILDDGQQVQGRRPASSDLLMAIRASLDLDSSLP